MIAAAERVGDVATIPDPSPKRMPPRAPEVGRSIGARVDDQLREDLAILLHTRRPSGDYWTVSDALRSAVHHLADVQYRAWMSGAVPIGTEARLLNVTVSASDARPTLDASAFTPTMADAPSVNAAPKPPLILAAEPAPPRRKRWSWWRRTVNRPYPAPVGVAA